MLARGVSRQHEISIRIALGAGRRRIFRQLCTESLMLAAMGAVVGLALACGMVRLVLMIPDAPGWVSVAPDWRVVLFTMGMTFVATMFFGLMPALRIARQGRQKTVARQFLVGAQIAASSILIIVAALLLRATQHALYADPGFGYEQMVSVDPQLGRHGYSPERARSYLEQMESRLRAEPGVVSVSLVKLPPLGHIVARSSLEVGGRTVSVYPNFVAPDFFRTMEIPLLLGRTFDRGEKNAVIVSDSFAKLQWPGKNPLGQSVGEGPGKSTVIGVVGDAHINARSDNDAVEQYWPPQPDDMPDMVLIVRASGEPGSLTPALKAMSSGLDASLFPEIRQLRVLFNEDVQQIEAAAAVVSLSGLLAVSLAAMGIFGLVAFVVTQRSREIAIRLALGARRASILNAVLRPFGWPMVLGMAAGTTFAALGSKLLRVLLYGVSNLDLASYLAALLLLSGIALTAVLLPAARSLRLDLAAVLHND
jgi:predicted permease